MADEIEPSDESLEPPDPTVRFNMDRFRKLGFDEFVALSFAIRRVDYHSVCDAMTAGCDVKTAIRIFL